MPPTDPLPTNPRPESSPAAWDLPYAQLWNAFRKLFEAITPWLVEFGSWLFGGLIAFNLVVVAALLTIGPVQPAVKVATTAFALALPLEVTGLFLLKLDQDLARVGFEVQLAQAFQEVHFPGEEQIAPPPSEARRKRRTTIVLGYSLGILTLSIILTVTGMTAALWYMAWWIGGVFLAMVLISPVVVIAALSTSQPLDSTTKLAGETLVEEETARQAKARGPQDEERP